MKWFIIVSVILLLDVFCLAGDGLVVTDVKIKDQSAEIFLNQHLVIRDIRIEHKQGRVKFQMPVYQSWDGTIYPQVKVNSLDTYDQILGAVQSGRCSNETGNLDFVVGCPKLLKHRWRLANVEVIFNRALSVVLGVVKNKDKKSSCLFQVRYPGRHVKENNQKIYFAQVVVSDPVLCEKIEKAVLMKFERMWKEMGNKTK